MKKLYLFVFLFAIHLAASAQVKYETLPYYGKLWNFVFDKTTPNKLYALTYKNHIMVSTNKGETWDLLYAFPNSGANLNNLRIMPNGAALSFNVEFTDDKDLNGLNILDLQTLTISEHFETPNWSDNPQISSYSIFDDSYDQIMLHTSYSIDFSPYTKVFYTADHGVTWNEIYYNVDYDNVHLNEVKISTNDPSVLYMARGLGPDGVNGGFFRSIDAGKTWTDNLPGIVIGTIAINPANSDELIAGTGITFGAGEEAMYKSIDGGVTWDEVNVTWSEGILDNVVGIYYNPFKPNHIWALEENEIAISTDGGDTWTNQVFPINEVTYYYGTGMTFNPSNTNHVIIATDVFPMYTSDYGATLHQILSPFYNVLSVTHADYGNSQHLFYGSQGGYFEKNLDNLEVSAYSTSSPLVYNPRAYKLIEDETAEGRVFIFVRGNDFMPGELFYSTDFGASKTSIMSDYVADLMKVVKDPAHENIYWAIIRVDNWSGRLYKIDIGNAASPEATEVLVIDEGVITGISISSTTGDLIVAKGIKVFKSTNGGNTWTEKSTGLSGLDLATDLIWDMSDNPFDNDKIMLATTQGLFSTTDRGEHWENIFSEFNTQKVSYSTRYNGVLITSKARTSELAYSLNNGNDWHGVSTETLQYMEVNDVDFNFSEEGIVAYFATPDLGIVSYPINDIILGIPESVIEKINVSVYPNPAVEKLYISLERSSDTIASVSVFDLDGKNKIDHSSGSILNVSSLNNGMYVLKVTTSKGFTGIQKFVKK